MRPVVQARATTGPVQGPSGRARAGSVVAWNIPMESNCCGYLPPPLEHLRQPDKDAKQRKGKGHSVVIPFCAFQWLLKLGHGSDAV